MRRIIHSEQPFRRPHEGVAAPTVYSEITYANKKSGVSPPSDEKTQS